MATASQRSHTVGVILPSWGNPFYHSFLQGVEEVAEQDQSLIFLCNTHDDDNAAWRSYAKLSAKHVDGILVVSHDLCERLTQESASQKAVLPLVTVDWPDCHGYSVQMDLETAGYLATQHLIYHGHRRIGLITFDPDVSNVRPIKIGHMRAIMNAGLQGDPGRPGS